MQTFRYFTACIALVATAAAARADDKSTADARQRQWIEVLRSDAPPQDKAITCKRLAVYGNQEAVPALAPLLSSNELASWARIALEAIPGPAADDALREAMKTLHGRLLVGVINSIGTRRDAQAVDGLAERLGDADAGVASAAAVALGHIGTPPATKALEQSLATAPAAVRSAIAEGCILCAERLLADGRAAEATRLYDRVRRADVPKPRLLEATRGAILARGSEGIPLLIEQLQSSDRALFAIGLGTSAELPGRAVTEALAAELSTTTLDRQVLLILAFANRKDDAVLPTILRAVKSGSKEMRTAAIGVLRRVGDASCVPALLETALEADEELSKVAKGSLDDLPGTDVDAEIIRRLPQAKGKMRQLLIELVGLRRIDAVPALLEAADDSDGQIRSAALAALGATVGPGDLSVLIARVVTPKNAQDTQAAKQALRAACIRMPDREACAELLDAAMPRAPVAVKRAILETLGAMGGARALASIAAAAKDENPELRDAASRVLGEWMTVDAAPVLLDLAKTSTDDKYGVRALRGYIRIARQFSMPDQQRAEMCRNALRTANRDAEKTLVLGVIELYPSAAMLELAVDATKIPSLKDAAAKTSFAVAQKLGGNSVDVQKLLAQVGHDPVKVEIIKAEYGTGTRVKDVTESLRQRVRDLPLVILPSSNYNSSFGGDPAPGIPKQLKVQYKIDDRPGEASFAENAPIIFPMPQ